MIATLLTIYSAGIRGIETILHSSFGTIGAPLFLQYRSDDVAPYWYRSISCLVILILVAQYLLL